MTDKKIKEQTQFRKLPTPEILNISLQIKEAGIGELLIEYQLPELPALGLSGMVLFLRPIQDPNNFPLDLKQKYPQRGNLSTSDIHHIFLPPTKKKHPSQISVLVPLYTTYQVGLASFRISEHSDIITQSGSSLTLDSQPNFDLSLIKPIKKTFPLGLVLPVLGTLRIEEEPILDNEPTYLTQQSQSAVQRYRLSETFIDPFKDSKYINLSSSHNIESSQQVSNIRIKLKDKTLIKDSVQLIAGLKAPNQPTTFTLPSPLETPDVYSFDYLTWLGQNIRVFASTGFGIGDVTQTENFRLIQPNQDIQSKPKEDSFNLRVDFLTQDALIKDVILHYTHIDPAIIVTNPIVSKSNFNQAVVFVDTDDLASTIVEMSNDGGRTFVESEGSEGVDLFKFPAFGNHSVLRIKLFGEHYVDGYAINTGISQVIAPNPIEGPDPINL
jgi:hypothetical protein